jgi:hypothetical protein
MMLSSCIIIVSKLKKPSMLKNSIFSMGVHMRYRVFIGYYQSGMCNLIYRTQHVQNVGLDAYQLLVKLTNENPNKYCFTNDRKQISLLQSHDDVEFIVVHYHGAAMPLKDCKHCIPNEHPLDLLNRIGTNWVAKYYFDFKTKEPRHHEILCVCWSLAACYVSHNIIATTT